jgi:hypothetical protein
VQVLTGLPSSFDHLEGGVGFEMQNIPREIYSVQTDSYKQRFIGRRLSSPISKLDASRQPRFILSPIWTPGFFSWSKRENATILRPTLKP